MEPLTSIQGLVELLEEITPKSDTRLVYIQQIREQIEALTKKMNTILLAEQVMVEEVLRVEEFDLKAMMNGLLEDLSRDFPQYAGRLIFEDNLPMVTIWQDQERIYRILEYLMREAFVYINPDEILTIVGSFDPVEKEIEFKGSIDIPPDDLANGLDLKLIELMVAKMGGRLSYHREGEDGAMSFFVPLIQ